MGQELAPAVSELLVLQLCTADKVNVIKGTYPPPMSYALILCPAMHACYVIRICGEHYVMKTLIQSFTLFTLQDFVSNL